MAEKKATKKAEAVEAVETAENIEAPEATEAVDAAAYEAKIKELEAQLAAEKAKASEPTKGENYAPDFQGERYAIVKLPLTEHEFKDEWVCVNGRAYQIQRGKDVRVPLFVAEAIEHKAKMERFAIDYIKKNETA